MYRGLVTCRTGMGSSMMLKIKLQKVIDQNNFPLELQHDVFSSFSVRGNYDLVITMRDLEEDVKRTGMYVIGIDDIMDMQYMKAELEKFFNSKS